ncbi:ABC transporter permease [Endozoicomonas ascidiicola]|uniref:ABC transporter permease n=1 Tax=Endozoicomonas ascidiicola TaxID=1698521 RepID=UPI00082F66B7|nr:ABC transporter permease [Endozoicomonas ascidiicola]
MSNASIKEDLKAWALMATGLGMILMLMGSTLYMAVAQSFGFYNLTGESGFSLEYWQAALSDDIVFSSLLYSMKVSFIGAMGSIALSYPLAIWLRKPMAGKEIIIGVLRAPMFVTGLVAAFLFVNIISYHGILNQLMMWLGLIDKPIRMQNDSFGWGVIFLQIWKNLPFALILVSGAVNSIRSDVLDAASDLGAGQFRKLVDVIIPLSIPAVQAAFILIFIGALGDFSFFVIAGPRNTYSLSMLMQLYANEYMEWNTAAVIGMIIILMSGVMAVLTTLLTNPLAFKKGRLK